MHTITVWVLLIYVSANSGVRSIDNLASYEDCNRLAQSAKQIGWDPAVRCVQVRKVVAQ